MGMLRHCATEVICATLCGPKKFCSNHCDSNWVCCDIVQPKLFARLCVAQKKFVATIATQIGYVATLCDRSYLRDFVWPKKNLLRPLRLKMGMLRHCATEVICATLFGPKKVCCDHCDSKWICCYHPKPNQLCCDRWNSGYVALSRIKSVMMRIMGTLQFCAIEVFLGEIVRLKKGMLRPLKLKTEFSQICATEVFLCHLA